MGKLKATIYWRYEDIPKNILEHIENQTHHDSDLTEENLLVVVHGNEVLRVESDMMEPEDTQFTRDLDWVSGAIQEAYEKGVEDGKQKKDK